MTPTDSRTRGPERFALATAPPERPSMGKALAAGLALLALVVGVPAALWFLGARPPIPTGLPTREQLTEPISLDALFSVLLAVLWLAWLQFVVCTVIEVNSFVSDRGLPQPVPLSGRSQALARALVGTFLVGTSFLASSGAASAVAAPAPERTAPVVQTVEAGSVDEASVQDVVESGNKADADADAEADGGQGNDGPTLRMVHVPGVPSEMTDVIGRKVAIVQPPDGAYHDNLWDIAERTMGDGRRWKEIYELNKGRVQPDGKQLVLGRLIQPGWVLIMPEDARNVTRVQAAADTPAPATPAPPTEEAPAPPADEGGPLQEAPMTSLATGGLLAAALLGALLAERRRRRGLANTTEELEAEVQLRIGADEERARRLDLALRGLAELCRTERVQLPQVYAVTVSSEAVELHLAPRVETAPLPWTVQDDGARWTLAADVDLPVEDGPAPYPALVCLGRDDEGRDVLLDLEALGGLVSLSGSDAVAREVASALAVQLAFSPWSDDQVAHGYRLSPAAAQIAGEQMRVVDDVDGLLASWSGRRRHRPAHDVLSGRLRRSDGETAHYLVLGEAPTAASVELLSDLTGENDRGVAVVSAVPVQGARWTLEVDDAGRLRVPLLDLEVQAVRITADTEDEVAALFAKARESAPVHAGDRVAVPRPPRAGEDDHWATAAVRVGVLGDLATRTTGQLDPARVQLASEVVVFLALQQAPVHPSVVAASVWPGGVTPEVRDATIARVRDWLGTDPSGNHLLREDADGRLLLADDVAVDWHAFCALALRARTAPPAEELELLRRALQLVRGEFLSGRPSQRYAWLPRTRLERQSVDLVVDSAHRVVELSLPRDPAGAATACRAGLRLAPASQVLWRDLVVAESQNPGGPGAPAVVAEMRQELGRYGAALDAETEALVEELLPSGASAHPHGEATA
ncbi:bacterial transcriptional activator domain-containing protein [Nocardioides jishulii]|uniref:Bacterial transcriptional activator domain-containing protein n=1 Tax=Nocardioides jishulii TaxID=2575440 RepID=A0A4U2YV23_9ACTN|nr:bacterial transcriptional activator domain-containing protein [Nocardioides jishulii]QCX28292.1 hypothetical protein FCL41_12755 [Nocardioides jishulii]TKI64815.1 hypothetical protein FC770_06815 [Nocardioides jishulii]